MEKLKRAEFEQLTPQKREEIDLRLWPSCEGPVMGDRDERRDL